MSSTRVRLDRRVVELGLCETRGEAQELIAEGQVLVNGAIADKAARLVAASDAVIVRQRRRFVSRGGLKLEGALVEFGVDVSNRRCLDVGSSTGGFIHCLVQRGAKSVTGVDVGRAQIHESILGLSGVEVFESTDIRSFAASYPADQLGFELVTIDVSFISLRSILGAVLDLVAPGGQVVALIKPQFEVGHREVSKGEGVITTPKSWHDAIVRVIEFASSIGLRAVDLVPSPLRGTKGNVEFFVLMNKDEIDKDEVDKDEIDKDEIDKDEIVEIKTSALATADMVHRQAIDQLVIKAVERASSI